MIRLCVFDLGGTIIDKYSLSPFLSIKHAFNKKKVSIKNNLIYKDMGVDKFDHINHILNNKDVIHDWFYQYGKRPCYEDSLALYDDYLKYQLKEGIDNVEIIPETKNCIHLLGENNISTGVTTGFSRPVMNKMKEKLIDNDIILDNYISSTCLGKPGRPNPYMIKELMNKLSINDPRRVIKVDDTVIGIHEGKNAGCITVGVSKWSSNMKMNSYDQIVPREEYIEKHKLSTEILWSANPDYVIKDLSELYPLIEEINCRTF